MKELIKMWSILMKSEQLDSAVLDNMEVVLNHISRQSYLEDHLDKMNLNERYALMIKKVELTLNEKRLQVQKLIVNQTEEEDRSKLQAFFKKVNDLPGDEFVFILSGTSYIQKVKGNRCVRLGLEFEKQGVPLIYGYWRWKVEEYKEPNEREWIFEIPIDQVVKYVMDIIKADIHQKHKTFIYGLPYPPLTKYLEVFKEYGWQVIYDIRDDWEEFAKIGQAKWYIKAHEIYAIEKAQRVMAVSKNLVEKFKPISTKNIELVPNALDTNFYIKEKKESQNIIGYVGHLTSGWLEWEGFIQIMERLPQYQFEIIGHTMTKQIDQLPRNVTFRGSKTFDEVKEIAKTWKVGIIPFKINDLTAAVDPIKVYEYLAMGLKVVSFKMPQIETYPEVKTASTIDEFVMKVEESMLEPFNQEAVDAFLEENTWEKRVELIRGWRI